VNIGSAIGNLPSPFNTIRPADLVKIIVGSFIFGGILIFSSVLLPLTLIFTPLYIVPMGYALLLAKHVLDTGEYFPLPAWTGWEGIARKGVAFFLIHTVYLVPSFVLLMLTLLLLGVVDTVSSELSWRALLEMSDLLRDFLGIIGPLIFMFLSFISWGVGDMAICSYLQEERFFAAFRFIKIIRLYARAVLRIVAGYLIYAIVFLALQTMGLILFGVGIFVTLFIALLLYEGMMARIYRTSYQKMKGTSE
jgi:hypothetical protein